MENNSNYQPNGESAFNQENELSIRDYLFILRLHIKKILFFTIIGVSIAFYNVLTLPPSYTATATVVVREKPGAGRIMDLTGNRDRNRMTNEMQLIESRSVAKATIKEIWPNKKNNFALFGSYPFYPRGQRARTSLKELFTLGLYDPQSEAPIQYAENYSDDIGERFSGGLLSRLSINHREGTDIIDISYTSVWPHEARLVVNTLVNVYQKFELKLSGEYAANSVEFLESLVLNQESKLNEAEKALADYMKQERMYDLDGNAISTSTQIAGIETENYNSTAEINIRNEKYNLLKSKLSQDEKSLADKLMNTIDVQVTSLRNEMSQLEANLIQNVAQHGEEHGAVKDLRKKLDALKSKLNSKVKELTSQSITVQDPLQARQNIVAELITLDSEITNYLLKKNESEKLLTVYKEKLNSFPPKQLQFSKLKRNSTVLNQNYVLLLQKLEEAKISFAVQIGKVQIVDYARLPGKSGQNQNRIMLMGLIFGLGLGIAIAFSLEFIDNTIKTVNDIERKNLTVLGIIPSIGEEQYQNKSIFSITSGKGKSQGSDGRLKRRLITREDPRSPVSEAYRSLRTSMLYSSSADKKIKSILISSAGPGEGKTTTVANLAITYANLGKKTLLVDTDLRRPVVHKVLEINKEPGVTDYLSGAMDDFNSLIQKTPIDNLFAVPSGIVPPNPSELLGSQKMANLIQKLENEWDMILFDSPPLVAVTDATMISKSIDQIVIVVKVGHTDKKAFNHTITSLRNVRAPLGGVILNAVTHKNRYGSYYYYYQYYHYYGSDKESSTA
jgi:capsular exopolysaccharide synthesis family protein